MAGNIISSLKSKFGFGNRPAVQTPSNQDQQAVVNNMEKSINDLLTGLPDAYAETILGQSSIKNFKQLKNKLKDPKKNILFRILGDANAFYDKISNAYNNQTKDISVKLDKTLTKNINELVNIVKLSHIENFNDLYNILRNIPTDNTEVVERVTKKQQATEGEYVVRVIVEGLTKASIEDLKVITGINFKQNGLDAQSIHNLVESILNLKQELEKLDQNTIESLGESLVAISSIYNNIPTISADKVAALDTFINNKYINKIVTAINDIENIQVNINKEKINEIVELITNIDSIYGSLNSISGQQIDNVKILGNINDIKTVIENIDNINFDVEDVEQLKNIVNQFADIRFDELQTNAAAGIDISKFAAGIFSIINVLTAISKIDISDIEAGLQNINYIFFQPSEKGIKGFLHGTKDFISIESMLNTFKDFSEKNADMISTVSKVTKNINLIFADIGNTAYNLSKTYDYIDDAIETITLIGKQNGFIDNISNIVSKLITNNNITQALNTLGNIKNTNKNKTHFEITNKLYLLVYDLGSIAKSLSKSIIYFILGSIGIKKAIEFIPQLDNLVIKLVELDKKFTNKQYNNTQKTLHDLAQITHDIAKIEISLTISAVLAPMAIIGLKLTNWFLKHLNKDMVNVITNKKTEKKIKQAEKNIDPKNKNSISHLLLTATLIMGIAILAGGFVAKHFTDIFMFTFALAFMVGAVVGVYTLFAPKNKHAAAAAEHLVNLIKVSAIVMLTGALVFKLMPDLMVWTFVFAIMLSSFVGMIIGTYTLASLGLKFARKGVAELEKLVVASAITMLIGALMFKLMPDLMVWCFVFTLMLSAFIFGIIKAYALASLGMRLNKNIKYVRDLVIASAVILLVGGLLFKLMPDLMIWCFVFTLMLSAFILGVVGAYKIAAKGINAKVLATASQLAILVAVSAATLLIGGMLFYEFPGMRLTTIAFGTVLAGFVWLMSIVIQRLANINKKDVINGAIIMGAISVMVLAAAGAMWILSKAVQNTSNWYDLPLAAITMSGVMLAFGVLAVGAGLLLAGPHAAAFILGVGAIAAISTVILISCTSMLLLANALKIMSSIDTKNFKVQPIIDMIGGMFKIAMALFPLGLPYINLIILNGALTANLLAVTLSTIAQAIEEYANLKVAIYQGTKKVGYRQLTESDFVNAAENVKKVITTLSGAILDVYNKNPQMFGWSLTGDTPYARTVKSCTLLGELISKIAEGVKDYADLKISIYKGTKKIGYKRLTKDDFTNAATNIKTVVLTLGNGIMQAYVAHKDWFEDDRWSLITAFSGQDASNTPFARVVSVTKKLGSLISTIGNAVKDLADLKIVSSYDAKGNPKSYRHLTNTDFQNATTNIKTIVTTLGNALMEVYEEHKDWFTDDRWSLITAFSGQSASETPFARVISVNAKLSSIISNFGDALKIWVHGVPKYNEKTGKVIGYSKLEPSDLQAATNKIKEIITLLTNSLMSVYNEHKDWFDDTTWYGSHEGASKTAFGRVVDVNTKLSKIISNIGEGLKIFAMGVPKYNEKTGKIIGYTPLSSNNLKDVKTMITNILTALTSTVINVVTSHEKWFDDDEIFNKAATSIYKLSNTISNIAKGVQLFGKGVPVYDKKTGKIIGYNALTDKDVKNASDSVSNIITCLADTIVKTVADHPEYFDTEDKDSKFTIASTAVSNLSNMIYKIAQAVQMFGKGVPQMNNKGTIIGYLRITDTDVTNAKTAINDILTAIGSSIVNTVKDNSKLFDDSENSPFLVACNSISKMTNIISEIAKAVQMFSKGAPKMNNKGVIIGYEKFDSNTIPVAKQAISDILNAIPTAINALLKSDTGAVKTQAAINNTISMLNSMMQIGSTIATIGEAVYKFTLGIPQYKNGKITGFTPFKSENINAATKAITDILNAIPKALNTVKDDKNVNMYAFANLCNSISNMGDLITNIAKAVRIFAIGIPEYKNGKFTGNYIAIDYNKTVWTAKHNIFQILTGIGDAINNVSKHAYSANTWFGNSRYKEVAESISGMGSLVFNVAKSVQLLSKGTVTQYNKNGKAIGTISNINIPVAKQAIIDILTTMGEAIDNVSKDKNGYILSDSKIKTIVSSLSQTSNVVKIAADAIVAIATASIPEYNSDGTIKRMIQVSDDSLKNAASTIETVLTAICDGIAQTISNPKYSEYFTSTVKTTANGATVIIPSAFSDAVKAISGMGQFIGAIGDMVIKIGTGIPIYKDGELKGYKALGDTELSNVKTTINNCIAGIFEAFNAAITDDKISKYLESNVETTFWGNKIVVPSKFQNAMTAIGGTAQFLSSVADVVIKLATGVPMYKDGKISYYRTVYFKDILKAKKMIEWIFKAILDPITNLKTYNLKTSGTIERIKTNFSSADAILKSAIAVLYRIWKSVTLTHIGEISNILTNANNNYTDINSNLTKLMGYINQSINIINNGITATLNGNNLTTTLTNTKTLYNQLLNTVSDIGKNIAVYKTNVNIKEKITGLVQDMNDIIAGLNTIQKLYNAENINTYQTNFGNLNNINTSFDASKLSTAINNAISLLKSLYDTVDNAKNINTQSIVDISKSITSISEDFENLQNADVTLDKLYSGITQLHTIYETGNQPSLTRFSTEVKTIDKLVTKVNSLQTTKMNSMITLAKSLNSLTNKFGNLDKLTTAITKNLSETLNNLANKIVVAKNTIDKTEKIQKERHSKMAESISAIKELMNTTLNVTVTSSQTTEDENPDPTKDAGDPDNKQAQTPGDTPTNGDKGSTNNGAKTNTNQQSQSKAKAKAAAKNTR